MNRHTTPGFACKYCSKPIAEDTTLLSHIEEAHPKEFALAHSGNLQAPVLATIAVKEPPKDSFFGDVADKRNVQQRGLLEIYNHLSHDWAGQKSNAKWEIICPVCEERFCETIFPGGLESEENRKLAQAITEHLRDHYDKLFEMAQNSDLFE